MQWNLCYSAQIHFKLPSDLMLLRRKMNSASMKEKWWQLSKFLKMVGGLSGVHAQQEKKYVSRNLNVLLFNRTGHWLMKKAWFHHYVSHKRYMKIQAGKPIFLESIPLQVQGLVCHTHSRTDYFSLSLWWQMSSITESMTATGRS